MFSKRMSAILSLVIILTLCFSSLAFSAQEVQISEPKMETIIDVNADFAEDHIIVQFKENMTMTKIKNIFNKTSIGDCIELARTSFKRVLEKEKLFIYKLKLNIPGKESVINAISEVLNQSNVICAQPDYYNNYCEVIPNDPGYSSQWHLPKISAPQGWEETTGSPTVLVGVMDTGIDLNHPDLQNNIWTNPNETANGIDDDLNGYVDDIHGWNFALNNSDPTDDYGHGTLCSGIIAAVGNNNVGITGLGWNVKIVPLKVSYYSSSQNKNVFTDSAIIDALDYAVENNVKVVNASFGGYNYSPALKAKIENYNGLFVAAAGNEAANIAAYPAAYPIDNIISVGATDSGDNTASFSNYSNQLVDIMAPGVSIYSTYPSYYSSSYITNNGTSFSAPMVAGTAALLLSKYPTYTTAMLKKSILKNCDKVSTLTNKCLTGGRLNVYRTLTDALPTGVTTYNGYDFDSATQTIKGYYGTATALTIPSTINGVTVKNIAAKAFVNNYTISSVTIPDTIESIGDFAFYGCPYLTSFSVSANNQYYSSLSDVLYNKNKSRIIQYPTAKNTSTSYTIYSGTTSIAESAFSGNKILQTIIIPSGVTTIPDSAFNFCYKLTGISLSNNVTSIGKQAFAGCYGITSLTLPINCNTVSNYAFYSCIGITTLTLKGSAVSLGAYSFTSCKALNKVDITGDIASIGSYAFAICPLPDLYIPYNANSNTLINNYALSSTTLSVRLPRSVTLGSSAFANIQNMLIYGYSGSLAQTYATNNNVDFQIYGDVNDDGTIALADAMLISQYVNNQRTFTQRQIIAADVNMDGSVTSADFDIVFSLVGGNITQLPNI